MATNFKAKPLSRKKIRGMADSLRQILGVGEIARVNVLKLLECVIAEYDDTFHYEVVEDSEITEMAIYYPQENKIIIRESVYKGARTGVGRDRFTIMHEMGHYFLHDNGTIAMARGDEKLKTYEEPEWQANVFAAEFLMPFEAIKQMTPDAIMSTYGVSLQAARYQHKKINEI